MAHVKVYWKRCKRFIYAGIGSTSKGVKAAQKGHVKSNLIWVSTSHRSKEGLRQPIKSIEWASEIPNDIICIGYSLVADTATDAGKSLPPIVDHCVLEPSAKKLSFIENDQLNSSILSFWDQFQNQVQDLCCDILEPNATLDSCHGHIGNLNSLADNEDDNINMRFSDKSLEKELQWLRPQKYI